MACMAAGVIDVHSLDAMTHQLLDLLRATRGKLQALRLQFALHDCE